MASTQSSATAPSLSGDVQSTCFDPLDVDAFIDFDQARSAASSMSPASSQSMPLNTTGSRSSKTTHASIAGIYQPSDTDRQDSFTGPSHQYDLHKQQTGLPVGALANTLAINSSNTFTLSSQPSSRGSRSASFLDDTSSSSFVDFNAAFGSMTDADLALPDSTGGNLPAFFFPESSSVQSSTEFVNPSTLGVTGESTLSAEPSPIAPGPPSSVGRLYPGMHSQQAALAKAQQEQNRSANVPVAPSTHQQQMVEPAADVMVEERISRLLKTMKHSSSASSEEEATTPNASGSQSHAARMRKEEEDMDEDERLLASEEGKKLSSKERRQLRNKVSARAFRSRRKEYIGQLEGEVAVKVHEADRLRAQNRALMEENRQLSDLTRMLLSSPAFSTFLGDLSNPQNPLPVENLTGGGNLLKVNTHKDADPYALGHQNMSVQESSQPPSDLVASGSAQMDLSTTENEMSSSWTAALSGNGIWGVAQPRVFSVFDVPQVPLIDHPNFHDLSEKSREPCSWLASDATKEGPLAIECGSTPSLTIPTATITPSEPLDVEFEVEEDDPSLALYADSDDDISTSDHGSMAALDFLQEGLFGFQTGKMLLIGPIRQDAGEGEVSSRMMDRFRQRCQALEAPLQRLLRTTSHL